MNYFDLYLKQLGIFKIKNSQNIVKYILMIFVY